jgi:hypothetical protein
MKYSKFKNLKDEAIRQSREIGGAFKQSSLRSQVLMGFVIGFISLLFVNDMTYSLRYPFDIYYIIIICLAGVFGFLAYWVRDYPIGVDVEELFQVVKRNPQKDEDIFIFKEINESNKRNLNQLSIKNKFLKAGYFSYSMGLLSFVIIKLISPL